MKSIGLGYFLHYNITVFYCMLNVEKKKRIRIHTYKSMLIRYIVGQFQLVEVDHFGHPLLAHGRTVRVDVHSFGHLRVRLPRHHPAGVMKLVSAVVSRHDV